LLSRIKDLLKNLNTVYEIKKPIYIVNSILRWTGCRKEIHYTLVHIVEVDGMKVLKEKGGEVY